MPQSIADKIDELLKSDATFTTRAGMRFMTEVVRDAFKFIEEEKQRNKEADEAQQSFITRLGNVETGLNDFLKLRAKEQERAETERVRWRWAIITPTIGLFFTMLALLITMWLKP